MTVMLDRRRRRATLALLLAALGSCATMPPAEFPPFQEHRVQARFTFRGDGDARAAVPASSPELTVMHLRSEPPAAGERFVAGQRFLLPPPGCTDFVVECHYRAYARADGSFPTPAELFPGAADVQVRP
jgi:hypothetical protein